MHPVRYGGITLLRLDRVSVLQDQDVVSVAKQQCGISKTLCTPSLPAAQKRTPFQSLDGTGLLLEGVHTAQINLKLNFFSFPGGWGDTRHMSKLNCALLLQMLNCSTSCCYDNLIIVDRGRIMFVSPMWVGGRIMCECEVVLFGQASHVSLQEKQL